VPNEFNTAISQLANVGFTFGGTFAGHGVYVTGGNARFILRQYSVSQWSAMLVAKRAQQGFIAKCILITLPRA
jgi:hypothetical protein